MSKEKKTAVKIVNCEFYRETIEKLNLSVKMVKLYFGFRLDVKPIQ
jgi:hypothetical protein